MDWSSLVAPLLTLAFGWLLRGEFARFTERGRLPDHVDRRLAIWERLPAGETKDELQHQIESDVRFLMAHDDRPTTQERLDLRWGSAFIVLPMLIVMTVFVERPGFDWPTKVLVIIAFISAMVGIGVIMKTRQSKGLRRWRKLAAAERAGIELPEKPAADVRPLP